MPKKEKRSFNVDTDALPGMKLTRAGHLPPQEHEAFIELMGTLRPGRTQAKRHG